MRAVVSFANTPFYQEKMKRLQDSVESQGIKFIGYKSFEEVGCRPHSEIPYQFKPYAIQKAINEGVTTLLWCDSPIVAVKSLLPVFEYIEEHGYMFFDNIGHTLGKWTNDKCLDHFGIPRETANNVQQIMACCMGFDFNRNQAEDCEISRFFGDYFRESGNLYPGSWDNHRHDQSVASCIIHEMKLPILTAHETFFAYEHFKDVPGWKIADSVCLISR